MKPIIPLIVIVLLVAGCLESESASSPTSSEIELVTVTTAAPATTTEPPSTTSTEITTTTVVPYSIWTVTQFGPFIKEYDEIFAIPVETHFEALQWTEASLDCVVAATHVDDWRAQCLPTPDDVLTALVNRLFDDLEAAIDLCEAAETYGDWEDVSFEFGAAIAVVDRISEHLEEASP